MGGAKEKKNNVAESVSEKNIKKRNHIIVIALYWECASVAVEERFYCRTAVLRPLCPHTHTWLFLLVCVGWWDSLWGNLLIKTEQDNHRLQKHVCVCVLALLCAFV